MTDATVSDGSWSYTKNLKVKSADKILHMLIDIVYGINNQLDDDIC